MLMKKDEEEYNGNMMVLSQDFQANMVQMSWKVYWEKQLGTFPFEKVFDFCYLQK